MTQTLLQRVTRLMNSGKEKPTTTDTSIVVPGYGTHICENESFPLRENRWQCRICRREWRKVRINTMLRRKKLR
jgi:hypothetical protein